MTIAFLSLFFGLIRGPHPVELARNCWIYKGWTRPAFTWSRPAFPRGQRE